MSRKFEGDDRQKDEDTLGSYYMGRMRAPVESERVMPRGLIASVVILTFAAILWYAYPDGEDAAVSGDVPLIVADTAAYKSKPEDPGGMEVRHQDSTVFNPLVKKSADQVERLLPQPEEPLNKEDVLRDEPAPAPIAASGLQLEKQEAEDGAEKVVAKDDAKKPAPLTELATRKPVEEKPEAKAEPKAEEKPAAKKEEKAAVASGAAAGFYMQLGSFKEASKAAEEWRKLQKKFPQSLSPLSSRVERADLAAKGIWYRLYAGPVAEGRARDICGKLKAENAGGCIVRKL